MRFVGFIKEQDFNIENARNITEMFQPLKISEEEKSKVIKYLDSGIFLCGAMSYIYDDKGNPIGNLDYYTDGEFIWPTYFPYYLKKYHDFFIDDSFIEHARTSNYSIKTVSDQKLMEIERIFDEAWGKKS